MDLYFTYIYIYMEIIDEPQEIKLELTTTLWN
jgi:hypothetical protein